MPVENVCLALGCRRDQGTLDLGASGYASRMDDTSCRMSPFASPGERSARFAVEDGAESNELEHPDGTFLDEHAHSVHIAQAGSRCKGVGDVEADLVFPDQPLVVFDDCGDAALCLSGRR
jgi:hypothetical protein